MADTGAGAGAGAGAGKKKGLHWPHFKAAPGSEAALQEEVRHLHRNEDPVVDPAPTYIARNEYGNLNDAHDPKSAGHLHDKQSRGVDYPHDF